MKILIIGGVAGGATTAARYRRIDEKAEIIIFEKDNYISYANCGLPYYIGNAIKEKEKLQVQTVEGMSKRYNLDIRIQTEVLSIDEDKKTVTAKNLFTNETYTETYDKLVLSCGAKPIIPNFKGLSEAENVFTLRNIPDTYRIKDYIVNNNLKSALVIGGGFIGIEMAENIRDCGLDVTLVEKSNQVLNQIDFEMAQIVHQELNKHGIKLLLNNGVKSFENKGKTVILEDGTEINSDIIILAIGVTPENTLVKDKNIDLGPKGHLIVDKNFNILSNNKPIEDIYAIGDMIEVVNFVDNSNYAVPLAWGANRQGRLLADIIAGLKIKESKIQGTSALKVFDLVVASTGMNEKTLKMKNIDYEAVHAHRANHASYYPNSSMIDIKILFNKESGKIYGAQAIGQSGTEKRIDVIATVMRLNGTMFDLSDIEICYAPPFSSAKDPVNVLGYIAENLHQNIYKMAYSYEIDEIIKNGGLLIDIRTAAEYESGHVEGAININVDELRDRLDEIKQDKDKPIYLNCRVGFRSYLAIKILYNNGYTNLYNFSGGYSSYEAYKYVVNSNLNK